MNQIKLKLMVLVSVLSLSALAFTPYLPLWSSSVGSPATPATLGAYVWYEPSRSGGPSGGLPTNGAIVTLSNLASTGAILDLTNGSFISTNVLVQTARLNGLDTLQFGGFRSLACTNFSVPFVHTQEVFLVISATNLGSASRGLFGNISVTNNYSLRYFNTDRTWQPRVNFNVGGNVCAATTNHYLLLDVLFASRTAGGNFSTIFTNGIQGLEVQTGITNAFGLTLGSAQGGDSPAAMSFAAMAIFTNELTALNRSLMSNYFTVRFSLTNQ